MPNPLETSTLTETQCLAGELPACVIHRKGLQQMVQLRGGLQNLGFDGAVQRTISWYASLERSQSFKAYMSQQG